MWRGEIVFFIKTENFIQAVLFLPGHKPGRNNYQMKMGMALLALAKNALKDLFGYIACNFAPHLA